MLNGEIFEFVYSESYKKLIDDNSLSGESKIKLARLNSKIKAELKIIEGVRIDLVKEYGEKQGNGEYKVTKEKTEQFHKQWMEVMEQETELNGTKVTINEVPKNLTVTDISNLDLLITFEEK
jgi:hypothetical protein